MTYIETDKLEQAIQLHLHKRTQLPLTHLPWSTTVSFEV